MADTTVVYVASRPLHPLRSGIAIRQYHILRAYASVANVRLVFFHETGEEVRDSKPLRTYCSSIHPVAVNTTHRQQHLLRLPRWRKRLEYVLASRPSAATSFYSEELRDLLIDLAASADLVHVARLHMAPHVEPLFGAGRHRPRLVLDLDDVETVSRARFLRAGFAGYGKGLLYGGYDLVRLWQYQRRAIRAFDRVFVCSGRDRDRLNHRNVVVVPNGADLPSPEPVDRCNGKTIVCSGSLSWPPNADAALRFTREVLPRIRHHVRDVRLLIVGSGVPPHIHALADGTSVFVLADVPSMDEYYRQATLMVVPLRVGGGTRIKVLEALSHGVPVVSTTLGCEGLDVVDGEHVLLEDDPSRFAERCVALLTDSNLRRRLAARGRALVAERYTWASVEATVAAMAMELTTAAAKRGATLPDSPMTTMDSWS